MLKRNELSHRLDALLVLADGMGGSGGGDIASSIVAQTVPDNVIEFLGDRVGSGTPDVEQMLRESFDRANHKVWTTRKFERPDLRHMGTTCVAAVVYEGVLTVANLGDSRAYLLRAGKLKQLTEDHSEVWEQYRAGLMTLEQIQTSRFRNRITRAIGLGQDPETDIFRVPLQEGDTVLLCSDGLTSEVRDADIARIMAGIANVQEMCDRLVDAALDHGGKDNVTVVALRYGNFVPLTLPADVEEDDTDPDQKWKAQISSRYPVEEEEEYLPPTRPRAPARRDPVTTDAKEPGSRRQTNSANGALIGLLIMMTLVAAAEGYLLYEHGIFKPKHEEAGKAGPPPKPVYDVTSYGTPQLLLKDKQVQDACLLIDAQGNPIVASQTGNLMRVHPTGAHDLLGGSFPSLPPRTGADPKPPLPAPAHADFALDANGNLFAIDPETKSISIFSKNGTRIGYEIGRKVLTAPVRIAVNAEDVIFVIDNHKLYRLEAPVKPAPPTTETGH